MNVTTAVRSLIGSGSEATGQKAPERLLPARPSLAPGVVVHEPMSADATWVLRRPNGNHVRVGPDMGRLLVTLDGRHDMEQLAQRLGKPWTGALVRHAVNELYEAELLGVGGPVKRASFGWVRYVPPMSVQFTLLRPERLLESLRPVIRVLASRPSLWVCLVILVGGVLAFAVQAPAVYDSLSRPLSVRALAIVVLGTLAATWLHEMGHGATLAHYGGKPNRMGIMIFYLNPVFFCDVSDGWRLPRKKQRTRIALAGIAVQSVIGGASALAAFVVAGLDGPADVHQGLLLFSVATFIATIVNFVPFVKFDGYIALMSHLDVPHLRDRSMVEARRWLSRRLFGGTYQRELPELRWAGAYGLACMVFPVYLIGLGLSVWTGLLQSLGWVGALISLLVLVLVGHRAVVGARKLLAEAKSAGARTGRVVLVSTAVVVLVVAGLALVRVPYSVQAGYVQDAGQVSLVVTQSVDHGSVRPGDRVELLRQGLVLDRHVGRAVVGGDEPRSTMVPISALLPIEKTGIPVEVLAYPLTEVSVGSDSDVGMARVTTDEVPLVTWLGRMYLSPLFE